jgi:hypothetical protein
LSIVKKMVHYWSKFIRMKKTLNGTSLIGLTIVLILFSLSSCLDEDPQGNALNGPIEDSIQDVILIDYYTALLENNFLASKELILEEHRSNLSYTRYPFDLRLGIIQEHGVLSAISIIERSEQQIDQYPNRKSIKLVLKVTYGDSYLVRETITLVESKTNSEMLIFEQRIVPE